MYGSVNSRDPNFWNGVTSSRIATAARRSFPGGTPTLVRGTSVIMGTIRAHTMPNAAVVARACHRRMMISLRVRPQKRAADLRRDHFVVIGAEQLILFARPPAFRERNDPER